MLDFYDTVKEIILKLPAEKINVLDVVRPIALENLEKMKQKNAVLFAKPSACAGALLYFSRGANKLWQREIVQELCDLKYRATGPTIRRVVVKLEEMKKHGVFTTNKS